jgi:hypothetical protein
LRLKELETLEKVTEKIGSLTVYDGLEGVLKNMVPRLRRRGASDDVESRKYPCRTQTTKR